MRTFLALLSLVALVSLIPSFCLSEDSSKLSILNVSYDPTRELYEEVNTEFLKVWKNTHSQDAKIQQSHGGSGKQARSVMDGLEADVVTLALAYDIDQLAKKGLLSESWQSKLPNNSSPYRSTIVFLVRKGNPLGIHDWPDLAKQGVSVITPNPKTSGGARWNYLAAWGFALKHNNNDTKKAKEFVGSIFKNVPVLDSGARAATTTFVQRQIGDVLLTWENEAYLAIKEMGKDQVELVIPSMSILAEPPVAVVDKFAIKHGTTAISEAYLKFLYSSAGQEIIAKNYYRPTDPNIARKYERNLPTIELFTIDETFGGWTKAQKEHFDDGGTFDQIYSGH